MLERIKNIIKSDNGLVLLGNLSASAFGLMIFMVLARGLDKSQFGAWALFISAAGLLDLMRSGLIHQAMVRAVTVAESETDKQEIISSAALLALVISIIASVTIGTIGLIIDASKWSLELFFQYYPFLILLTLPSNIDTWRSHSLGKYNRMNFIRLYINILFLLLIGVGIMLEFSLKHYILTYLASNGAVSIYSMISLRSIKWINVSKERIQALFSFGKHSLATLTGANLLKSADSLIIGALMGTEAVAIYAVPLKAMDLMEIPLRGFVMTAFRKLATIHQNGQINEFKKLFWLNVKRLTLMGVPAVIFIWVFPNLITQFLGGTENVESNLVLIILTLPMLLLPLDKFLGASFDSINQPKTNAIKVWIMVTINILGDFAVIYLYQSLWMVAAVTVANILLGIIFGLLSHPYFKPQNNTISPFNQKSTIKFQSTKTQ